MTEKSFSLEQKHGESLALMQALKHFSVETERLESLYRSLEDHFISVQSTLHETQTKLYGKLAELNFTMSYLDTILSHISQGILFIDLKGIVTTYNSAAVEMFEIGANQLLFHPIWDFFSDSAFGFSFKEALRSGGPPKRFFVTWSRLERKMELEIETTFVGMPTSLFSTSHQKSRVEGLLVIVRDITEFRNLQSLNSRYDRLKELGEMASRVAHEIRNPLGGIKGFASLLKQDLKDRPDLEQMASQIIEGTDSLNRFVSNILDYTRPFQPQFISVDLVPFINDILRLVEVDRDITPGTTCQFYCHESALIVSIDPSLFKSALLNLCINALQSMPDGGSLSVSALQIGSWLIIEVSDTGAGISGDNLDKIFSPFFTTKDRGNGLGLSEVHKIIQAHNGTIEVVSKVGEGSRFILKMPLGSMQ
jgi:signal transduction histidine kinase